jgi:hypothetical protein
MLLLKAFFFNVFMGKNISVSALKNAELKGKKTINVCMKTKI